MQAAEGNLDIVANTGNIINRGTGVLYSGNDVRLSSSGGGYISNYAGGVISAGRDLLANAGTSFTNSGEVFAVGVAAVQAGVNFNNYGLLQASTGNLSVSTGGYIINRNTGTLYAEGDVDLGADGYISNYGAIAAAGDFTGCLLYTSPSPRD